MEISHQELQSALARGAVRPVRRTLILQSYDPATATATVAPVVNPDPSQVGGPYPVVKALQVLSGVLVPGALVVVERLTGRTPMITDVADRPVDTGLAYVAGDRISGAAPTLSDGFTDNSPLSGQVSWPACTLTAAGRSYPIAAGSTDLPYIYWTPGYAAFTPSATIAATDSTDVLVATNRAGIATVILATGGHDGAAVMTGTLPLSAVSGGLSLISRYVHVITDPNPAVWIQSWTQVVYVGTV